MIGGLILNEEIHRYTRDGIPVPSVSAVMGFMGLFPNKQWFKKSDAQRGTDAHDATVIMDECKDSDEYEFDWDSITDIVKPYAKAYQAFQETENYKWEYAETLVFNDQYWYAGKLDRAGLLHDYPVILDIKTGKGGRSVTHGIQTAAYDMCMPELDVPRKRWVLYLRPDESYKLYEYTDPDDYSAFKRGAWLYSWGKKHKIKELGGGI